MNWNMLVLALVIGSGLAVAGCGDDCELDGTWGLTVTWAEGGCQNETSRSFSFEVVGGSMLIAADESVDLGTAGTGATITGQLDSCEAHLVTTSSTTSPSGSFSSSELVDWRLSVDADGRVTGTGTLDKSWTGGSCSQAFTVSGRIL